MIKRSPTSDLDIRTAFHAQYLRRERLQPNTLVVDELGLAHAKSRVDIAVINGCVHGYEIKSAKDTLERLESQVEIYRRALQKLTIVAAHKHVSEVLEAVPDWCGVIAAFQGPRGGVHFESVRAARFNTDVDAVTLAHLLWRTEVVEVLARLGYQPKELRKPRLRLYELLCKELSVIELAPVIRDFMLQRQAWRGPLALEQCGG